MKENNINYRGRLFVVAILLLFFVFILLWRLIDLSVFDRNFLLQQSDARAVRVISTPAYRGMITDRFGTPLAISTPVDSAWINPQMFEPSVPQLNKLAKLLNMRPADIKQKASQSGEHEFMYLKRELPPETAEQIKDLNIPGLFFQREYRRYYPEGEVVTHVLGFTNIDEVGQEGLELGFDKWLRGVPGKERVLKDRLGYTIAIMDVLTQPVQGQDLTLSIDDRIQYLAYKNLVDAVAQHHAASGSVVVLNPKTGEILAMANVPSYNPNARPLIPDGRYRNRAVTDTFEPGSTAKTFGIIADLESGKYNPQSIIDTNPGTLFIPGRVPPITDDVPNNGVITLTQVLERSSNIGIAKTILSLPPGSLYKVMRRFGLGQVTGSGFPGEVSGSLVNQERPAELTTMSFGYALSVTALQLAHAYAAIANNGVEVPVTFTKQTQAPQGKQILDPKIAAQVMTMLAGVVNSPDGTAKAAAIPGYQVGGKTGTAYIAIPGGYDKKRYTSSFVGIAPMSNPQLVTVVVLNGVQGDMHFGAQTAAPLYTIITSAALRILDIPPDNLTAGK